MAPLTVFISYSSADRREALEVRRLLQSRGCDVWLDVFDLRVAPELKSELGGGIDKADMLCLLLSPSAVASPWVAEEITRGQEQATARAFRTIAVVLRPCRVPDSLGKVMLDATAGLMSPDVRARLARAVLGQGVVNDAELDSATKEALRARQGQVEAAAELPRFAKQLEAVRYLPIRKLHFSFQPAALPTRAVLAVSLTFASQPMRFLFAHFREGHTWRPWMRLDEPARDEVRGDGKRVAGRFEWSEKATPLVEEAGEPGLPDGPAAFTLELPQTLETLSLAALVQRGGAFDVTILGEQQGVEQQIVSEENDLELRVTALYGDRQQATLFRSNHRPLERNLLEGAYLSSHGSEIEREAILGAYPRSSELADAERQQRREREQVLLGLPEAALSPEERRVVATLRHREALLLVVRVFGNAPPPGRQRKKLHAAAVEACEAVVRLLMPLIASEPRFHDVGMAYWAASNLAHFHETLRAPEVARQHGEAALHLVEDAAARVPDEPEFVRWVASARDRLRRASQGSRA